MSDPERGMFRANVFAAAAAFERSARSTFLLSERSVGSRGYTRSRIEHGELTDEIVRLEIFQLPFRNHWWNERALCERATLQYGIGQYLLRTPLREEGGQGDLVASSLPALV